MLPALGHTQQICRSRVDEALQQLHAQSPASNAPHELRSRSSSNSSNAQRAGKSLRRMETEVYGPQHRKPTARFMLWSLMFPNRRLLTSHRPPFAVPERARESAGLGNAKHHCRAKTSVPPAQDIFAAMGKQTGVFVCQPRIAALLIVLCGE